jgi:hypothetical protein
MSNSSLIDGLLGQLQGVPTDQIAQKLGIDPATARNAISSALPMIMGTLNHNAQQPGGAEALSQALQNHTGDLTSVLGSVLGGQAGQGGILGGLLGSLFGGGASQNPQADAGGILGHIFGNAQSHAQEGLGQASGLGAEKAGQLLSMLAPVVMAHLANHTQTNNLDANGLSAALSQEHAQVQSQGGLGNSLLNSVLSHL